MLIWPYASGAQGTRSTGWRPSDAMNHISLSGRRIKLPRRRGQPREKWTLGSLTARRLQRYRIGARSIKVASPSATTVKHPGEPIDCTTPFWRWRATGPIVGRQGPSELLWASPVSVYFPSMECPRMPCANCSERQQTRNNYTLDWRSLDCDRIQW